MSDNMNDGLDFLNDTLDFLNNSFGAGPASSDSGDGKPVSKNNKVLVVGAKESFLIRVMVKKIQDAGIPCEFAPWEVNDIYSKWKDTGLVTAYMDDGLRPGDDAVRFLTDKLAEEDKKQKESYISLLLLTKGVLEDCIGVLGFEAPEFM